MTVWDKGKVLIWSAPCKAPYRRGRR